MLSFSSAWRAARLERLADLLMACQKAMFKMVDWILEYSPIGVLALTVVNFGLNGPKIVGPYVSVALGIVLGILVMVFVVCSVLLWAVRSPQAPGVGDYVMSRFTVLCG